MRFTGLYFLAVLTFAFTACKEFDDTALEVNHGAFILNQGTESSAVSQYNYENKSCANNIFRSKNGNVAPATSGASIVIRKGGSFPSGRAYVVDRGTNTIQTINMANFVYDTNFGGLNALRHVLPVADDKMYVTSSDSLVIAINTTNQIHVDTVITGKGSGAGKMVLIGKYLYVANQSINTISVIDISKNSIVSTVKLELSSPVDMVVDASNGIWVYCQGESDGSKFGLVQVIRNFNTGILAHTTKTITGVSHGNSENCLALSLDLTTLYFVNGKVVKMSVYTTDTTLPETGLLGAEYKNTVFTSLATDSKTGYLYCAQSNEGANGKLFIFNNTHKTTATLIEQYEVGIRPVSMAFNY